MKDMVLWSMHDLVADTWSFPQVSPTVEAAVRDARSILARPNVPFEDIEVIQLGLWYDGEIKKNSSVLIPRPEKKEIEQ